MFVHVTVTLYVECLFIFWYVRNERRMVQTIYGFTFKVKWGVVITPLLNFLYKRLDDTRGHYFSNYIHRLLNSYLT